MLQTGTQHAESHTVIKVCIWISHLACLGVFFLPLTPELLVACAIGYVWPVLAMGWRRTATSRTAPFAPAGPCNFCWP